MNKFHLFSFLLAFIGISFFFIGFLFGDVESGFFVIFPFLLGSGIYAFLGFIFIFLAILLFMFGFSEYTDADEFQTDNYETKLHKKTPFKGGGIVLIGPIPIVFGSSVKIVIALMIIAIIFIIGAFLLFRYF